jgi:hypothetical protein
MNGVRFSLELREEGGAVVGTASSRAGDRVEERVVRGEWDPERRTLVLREDPVDGHDVGYAFEVAGDRLVGSVNVDGNPRAMSLTQQ